MLLAIGRNRYQFHVVGAPRRDLGLNRNILTVNSTQLRGRELDRDARIGRHVAARKKESLPLVPGYSRHDRSEQSNHYERAAQHERGFTNARVRKDMFWSDCAK